MEKKTAKTAPSKAVPSDAPRTIQQCIDSFNRGTKLLTTDLYNRHKEDPKIWQAHRRGMTVINYNPTFVMEIMGPYLYKYSKQIYAADESFFIENGFDEELKTGVKEEKVEMSRYIIPKVKMAWKTLKDDEKKDYQQMVASLLDDYIDYLEASAAAKLSAR